MSTINNGGSVFQESGFLRAMSRGRHRNGAGHRLRRIVGRREIEMYGVVACFCCGSPVSISAATLEHITPQSKGGKTVLDNLALSHKQCNVKRGDSGTPRTYVAKVEGGAE